MLHLILDIGKTRDEDFSTLLRRGVSIARLGIGIMLRKNAYLNGMRSVARLWMGSSESRRRSKRCVRNRRGRAKAAGKQISEICLCCLAGYYFKFSLNIFKIGFKLLANFFYCLSKTRYSSRFFLTIKSISSIYSIYIIVNLILVKNISNLQHVFFTHIHKNNDIIIVWSYYIIRNKYL